MKSARIFISLMANLFMGRKPFMMKQTKKGLVPANRSRGTGGRWSNGEFTRNYKMAVPKTRKEKNKAKNTRTKLKAVKWGVPKKYASQYGVRTVLFNDGRW